MIVNPVRIVSAGSVAPHGPIKWVVVWCGKHETLRVGDVVRMVESPEHANLLYRDSDYSLHDIQFGEQYVMLCPPAFVEYRNIGEGEVAR